MNSLSQNSIADKVRNLRSEYISSDWSPSYYQINNGLCEDFAEELLRRLESEFGKSDTLFTVAIENFYKSDHDTDWDDKLLETHWSIRPPDSLSWDALNKLNFGSHIWLTFEKRHYDAECPEGVNNFLDLPIFRRTIIHHLRSIGVDCEDVHTDDVAPPSKFRLR